MATTSPSEHIHCASLSALLAHDPDGRPKSHIAADAGLTPANLRELETGVRSGSTAKTRGRVAAALCVDPLAITCWCDRPDGRCRSCPEDTTP